MSFRSGRPSHASTFLVRAAMTAPSLLNTQPWRFVADGDMEIELHADTRRGLPLADPHGRELVLGCGAALFNMRLAMLHLGFRPVVHTFPDPQDPAHLATVGWGAYTRPTEEEHRLYAALGRRHTAHGPFLPEPLPRDLVDDMRDHTHREGADLHVLDDVAERRLLAELVRVGEEAHRTDARLATEQAAWTWRLARPRDDGVPADVSVLHPDSTALAGRDYAGLTDMFPTPPRRWPARTGLVVLLATGKDDPLTWLRSGQALQRLLLHAAGHGVMAAFHTQPLEVPHLRTRVRQALTAGQFPQVILRLGHAPRVRALPRRALADVLG
ncbi:Acg family FMN-binding oxidoreductase [Streptomyces sp. IPPR8]|uniref:Acg family FMN-binding oxidoreductase n=1 Tax=Streptomyces sp. IPPR8 TaxID=3417301 RepID=UPI003D68F7DF